MTKRVGALRASFKREGANVESYQAIYDESVRLKADMEGLKERQSSVLDKLEESRDAWKDAFPAGNGRLRHLETRFGEQQRAISANESQFQGLEDNCQELHELVTALQAEISHAKYNPKTTQDGQATIRQNTSTSAESSVAGREQKLASDILRWARRVDHAHQEQQAALKAILQRDLNIPRNASDQKDKEPEDLEQQAVQLRSSAASVGSKDKQIEDLRKQILDLKDTVRSKESDISKLDRETTRICNDARSRLRKLRNGSAQKDKEVKELQDSLQGMQNSSEEDHRRHEEGLETERRFCRQKMEGYKAQNDRQALELRKFEEANISLEQELSRTKERLMELSTTSGLDQLHCQKRPSSK